MKFINFNLWLRSLTHTIHAFLNMIKSWKTNTLRQYNYINIDENFPKISICIKRPMINPATHESFSKYDGQLKQRYVIYMVNCDETLFSQFILLINNINISKSSKYEWSKHKAKKKATATYKRQLFNHMEMFNTNLKMDIMQNDTDKWHQDLSILSGS